MTGIRATSLLNSFMVSVFPTPASPNTATPLLSFKDVTMLSQHLSVAGVITKREVIPFYSHPYLTCVSKTLSLISFALSPSLLNLNIVFHSHDCVDEMLSSDNS